MMDAIKTFITHDALGSSPRGMTVVLDMILKTQSISNNTTFTVNL